MTRTELIEELKTTLQREEALTEDMELIDIAEYDSLATLGVIALFDKLFAIVLDLQKLEGINTVGQLMDLAKDKLEG